ncbi:MAG: PP2C family protein-serine/threonine phosphatase [Candidatus Acidiferrales bacterium]|jgi:sigma-B regulation protein RsbU (phosphoserine phosphatase)
MAETSNPEKRSKGLLHSLRDFWARVTEGLKISQLWGQFKSEATATYGFYSKDVDREAISQEKSKFKRFWRTAWGLFLAMLMKLSPARRVLLIAAILLLVIHDDNFDGIWLGAVILFLLLALELADRVTMKRDLEIAREIQQWLVPAQPPIIAGVDIAFATRPQNTVAGDYYDAFLRPLPSSGANMPSLLIAVADVAGKSVPAALLMATFQASLRALAATPASLDEIVVGLERYARAHSLEGLRFTTAFLAEINVETREMSYVNCGHNDPILRRASGEIERLSTGGPPLGTPLFTENEIPYPSGRTQLQPGDLIFIFTDGVVEAVNEAGEEYSEARLLPCVRPIPVNAADVLARVMTDVNNFVGYARQHDDITALVLRVTA